MNRIKNIIDSLKRNDISIVENYIQYVSRSNRKVSLLKLINNGKVSNDIEASMYLFKMPSNNIKKLKERLLSDIEDVILLRYRKNNLNSIYEKNEANIIICLLLTHYYLQNGLLAEANIKLRKISKILLKHDSLLLDVIYQQLWCNYLERTGNEELRNELLKLSGLIVELNYLNQLKVQKNTGEYNIFNQNTDDIQMLNSNSRYHFYTKYFQELTQINSLIEKKETTLAEIKTDLLLSNLNSKSERIPPELIVEAQLQMIKINIIHQKYADNKPIFKQLDNNNYSSESLMHEYLFLKFLNYFKLRDYELCSNIIKYVTTDSVIKNSTTRIISFQWRYFDICLHFIRKKYSDVIKLIALLPGKTVTTDIIYINTKILELYALILLDRVDIAYHKIVAIKQIIRRIETINTDRYLNLVVRIEKLLTNEKISFENRNNIFSSDILNFELISVEHFETEFMALYSKSQVAL